ncbi:hypothetical protein G6F58_007828 [Rhizopus delemar]|nr:hypothetical protein G6F58_007828 [Rhizopus delemar]
MEEGVLDECFVIDKEHEIPPELIVSVHVLCTTADDFQKMEEKQKLPKPKLTKEIKEKLQIILTKRLERYPKEEKSIEELKGNKRNANIVCIGEKSILKDTLKQLESTPVAVEKRKAEQMSNKNNKKHK